MNRLGFILGCAAVVVGCSRRPLDEGMYASIDRLCTVYPRDTATDRLSSQYREQLCRVGRGMEGDSVRRAERALDGLTTVLVELVGSESSRRLRGATATLERGPTSPGIQ
jgi:hypothetical protein